MEVKKMKLGFWDPTPRGLANRYQRFAETYNLQLQGWMR
jgi:hypothetical protein